MEHRWSKALTDSCVGVLALAVVALWTWLEVGSVLPQPALEDAAMLFRYADNFAAGGGIAWNNGEDPGATDGATDLGFVLALAPFILLGMSATFAAWTLNCVAVFGLGFLISRIGRDYLRLTPTYIWLFVALVMSTFINRFVTSGFSPPIFSLILTMVIVVAFSVVAKGLGNRWNWFALGLMAGVVGWWRPEGFAIGPILAIFAILISADWRELKSTPMIRTIGFSVVGLLIPIIAWIVFRILYFGHLLPSSAVMKSGSLTRVNALETLQFLVLTLLPVIAAVVVVGLAKRNRLLIFLIAIIASSLLWIPVTLHLNWWNRMQWPLVIPLGLLAIASVSARHTSSPNSPRTAPRPNVNVVSAILLAALGIATLRTFTVSEPPYTSYQPHTGISQALEKVDTSQVRLATSEAGLVPLSINGPALDTYGFNNYAIASTKGGELSAELDRLKPNVIIVNGKAPEEVVENYQDASCVNRDLTSYSGEQWVEMTEVLVQYAGANDMELIRSTETGACNVFSIFVSQEISAEVVDALRAVTPGSVEILQ